MVANHRRRRRPAAAEQLTLAEHGGHRLQHLAPAGGGQVPQPGQVAGQPYRLGGLAGTGGVTGRAEFPAQVGDRPGGGGPDPFRVAGGGEDGLLPARVADPGRVAGPGVEQVERVRHQRGDRRAAAVGPAGPGRVVTDRTGPVGAATGRGRASATPARSAGRRAGPGRGRRR